MKRKEKYYAANRARLRFLLLQQSLHLLKSVLCNGGSTHQEGLLKRLALALVQVHEQ